VNFGQIQPSLLSVSGRFLMDDCGDTIILKGFNHGNIWTTNWGVDELPEIEKTGANCVRICLERTWYNWSTSSYESTTSSNIEPIINACLENKMIPILELHDFTISNDNAAITLQDAVNFWSSPTIINLIKKYQNYLIINIANEPEHADMSDLNYYNANIQAIYSLRNVGLEVPLMIDAKVWGTEENFFFNFGQSLLQNDPLHKLIFSVHAYWDVVEYSDQQLSSKFNAMALSNLPFVLGEFSFLNAATNENINYIKILQLMNNYKIGGIAWWWGFINQGSNNTLSFTQNGLYSGLSNQGLAIAVTDAFSIKNTSKRPHKLVYGMCENSTTNYQSFFCQIYPNPVNDKSIVKSNQIIKAINIIDCYGNNIIQLLEINSTTIPLNFQLKSGAYLMKIEFKNGQLLPKNIIVL
jgi:mannan endo-1,4-beta-mannosidase